MRLSEIFNNLNIKFNNDIEITGISIDSRNNAMGCVAEEQIVGQLIFKVWPINEFGEINH